MRGLSVKLHTPKPDALLHGVPSHPTAHSDWEGQSTYGLGHGNCVMAATAPVLLVHVSPSPNFHGLNDVRAVRLCTPQSHTDGFGKNTHVLDRYGHTLGHFHALVSKSHTRLEMEA